MPKKPAPPKKKKASVVEIRKDESSLTQTCAESTPIFDSYKFLPITNVSTYGCLVRPIEQGVVDELYQSMIEKGFDNEVSLEVISHFSSSFCSILKLGTICFLFQSYLLGYPVCLPDGDFKEELAFPSKHDSHSLTHYNHVHAAWKGKLRSPSDFSQWVEENQSAFLAKAHIWIYAGAHRLEVLTCLSN